MRQTLWTKNFTIITLGTVISAIGGGALSFFPRLLGFVTHPRPPPPAPP